MLSIEELVNEAYEKNSSIKRDGILVYPGRDILEIELNVLGEKTGLGHMLEQQHQTKEN